MSLEPNFVPPEKAIAEAETEKRNQLITWFAEAIDESVVAMIVSGSMGYGYNYSVKETSDIDMQLIITPETVFGLKELDVFDPTELERALAGYAEGIYGQFSLAFKKDGASMECHFWDLTTFIRAITYQTNETKRLRSSIDTPSTDHGFSFSRDEDIEDYYGEIIHGYAVGVLPSYREVNNTLYLCRPITNILGLPRIEKSTPEIDAAIDKTWGEIIKRLATCAENGILDLAKFNIENSLPGKNKMRQDVLEAIRQKTREKLKAAGVRSIN